MIPKKPLHRQASFQWKWKIILGLFLLLVIYHWLVLGQSSTGRGDSTEYLALPPLSGQSLYWKVTEGIYTYREPLRDSTSPLGWDAIAPFVTNVQVGSFCLPWTQGQSQSDEWWTHHPEWQVFNETDQGYCFQPRPNPTLREYLTQVYQHQFSGNCSNLFVVRMWSSGWSADITNLMHTLQYALLHRQVMQITSVPWHYAAPDQAQRSNQIPSPPACPLLTMYCYLLPLTHCPVQPPDSHDRTYNYLTPPRMTPRSLQGLPEYIVRPQTWLRHKIWTFVQQQRQMAIPTSAIPCTVIHVRRGDVVHHGNSSRRYHSLSEYLAVPRNHSWHHLHRHLLLLTDDANAIAEAQQLDKDEKELSNQNHHVWMYIDRPRFRADEGGWEHQVPSSNPIFEMTVLLATFELVQQCQSMVYSTSGFSNWLLQEMKKVTPDVQHFNLDDVVQYELGTHNLDSKAISTAFQTNNDNHR